MVNKANLQIAKLVPKSDQYGGLLVTPSETVETDGSQLIRVSVCATQEPEDFDPFMLPRAAALDAAKTGALSVHNTHEARGLARDYPDWKRVIPDEGDATLVVSFNARTLARVLAAAADFCRTTEGSKMPVVTLRFYGPNSALRIDIEGDEQEFTGVVMPCRLPAKNL